MKVKEELLAIFIHVHINLNPEFSVLESDGFHVFLGLASIPVVFTLIGLAHMIWKNCDFKCKCCALCKDLEKQDVNDIYGTYARGWDGEGDYGDGDRVYISHSNPDYLSSVDQFEGKEVSKIVDVNTDYDEYYS